MSYTCPQCKQPLIRVRRKKLDRLMSTVFPVRRFQCVFHKCRWNGLRWMKREDLQNNANPSSLSNAKLGKDSIQH